MLLGALALGSAGLSAQTYDVGDVVGDYTLVDYDTGQNTTLYELGADGGVLVLEWFAYWCPFCASAAANVETGIVEHYANNGGNPFGVPVKHIAVNVQGGSRSQSDQFIAAYGFQTVVEDYNRAFFRKFEGASGQPLFAIINAEANSPSSEQWELLYTRLNYAGNEASDISALMRPVIDSVELGTASDPVLEVFPHVFNNGDGWYQMTHFGWFNGGQFPWVYHTEFGYIYLPGASEEELYFYLPDIGWVFSNTEIYPFLYNYALGRWLYYLRGTSGEWYYDHGIKDWQQRSDYAGS